MLFSSAIALANPLTFNTLDGQSVAVPGDQPLVVEMVRSLDW